MDKKKLLKILILIFWMGIIFAFSHQPNSGEATYNIIEKVLPTIQTNDLIEVINFIIRKSAHLIEYFILTLLSVSLLKEYTKNKKIIIITSLIFCFIYACTDEFHQAFVIGRTNSFRDVLIDTTGGLLFIITYIIYNLKYKRNSMNQTNS